MVIYTMYNDYEGDPSLPTKHDSDLKNGLLDYQHKYHCWVPGTDSLTIVRLGDSTYIVENDYGVTPV